MPFQIKKIAVTVSLFIIFSAVCIADDTTRIIKLTSAIQLQDLQQKKSKISLTRQQEFYLFIFLSPECPLCQNYSRDLNNLFAEFRSRIAFYGIIPGKAYSAAQVKKFSELYHIKFNVLFDRSFQLAKLLEATTTPEVYLLNKKKEVLYSGKIDNLASGLGIKRAVVTDHYLNDAILSSLNNNPVKIKFTHPVGCLINSY